MNLKRYMYEPESSVLFIIHIHRKTRIVSSGIHNRFENQYQIEVARQEISINIRKKAKKIGCPVEQPEVNFWQPVM